jgi:hypothetical protein
LIETETALYVPHEFGPGVAAGHHHGDRPRPALLPATHAAGQHEEDREHDRDNEDEHDNCPHSRRMM